MKEWVLTLGGKYAMIAKVSIQVCWCSSVGMPSAEGMQARNRRRRHLARGRASFVGQNEICLLV